MRVRHTTAVLLLTIGALLMFAAPDLADALVAQDAELQQVLTRARESIDKGEARDALKEIEEVLDQDDGIWTAHFLKGLALGQLGDEGKALESFLQAADLAPGTPQVHFWAGVAAFGVGDFDECWHQTILAHLAGQDMTAEFKQLNEVSDPPDDWEAQIAVPRVVVGQMDTSVAGKNTNLETQLRLVQSELLVTQRMLATELLESPVFGLVRTLGLADYVMRITVTDYGGVGFAGLETRPGNLVDRRAPGSIASSGATGGPESNQSAMRVIGATAIEPESHELIGQLQLFHAETGELVHFMPFTFGDLTSAGDLNRDIRMHVERMEVWARENPSVSVRWRLAREMK